MPWSVIVHILFISVWVGSLSLVMALCADRAAGSEMEDEPLLLTSLRLFAWVASLGGVAGVVTGAWLAYSRGFDGGWLPLKLVFVAALSWLHIYIGRLVARLRDGVERHHGVYWLMSALPPLASLPIFYFVLAKPI
jgi:putative membrane protein